MGSGVLERGAIFQNLVEHSFYQLRLSHAHTFTLAALERLLFGCTNRGNSFQLSSIQYINRERELTLESSLACRQRPSHFTFKNQHIYSFYIKLHTTILKTATTRKKIPSRKPFSQIKVHLRSNIPLSYPSLSSILSFTTANCYVFSSAKPHLYSSTIPTQHTPSFSYSWVK